MSIKKVGQDGEYHHLSDKKKFLFTSFLSYSGNTRFHQLYLEILEKNQKETSSK